MEIKDIMALEDLPSRCELPAGIEQLSFHRAISPAFVHGSMYPDGWKDEGYVAPDRYRFP